MLFPSPLYALYALLALSALLGADAAPVKPSPKGKVAKVPVPPAKPAPPLAGKPPPGPIVHPPPPPASLASQCGTKKDCNACVNAKDTSGKAITCGFTFASAGKCVPVQAGVKLATTAALCQQRQTELTASTLNTQKAAKAKTLFIAIQSHVFDGVDPKTGAAQGKTSGKHLLSTWVKANGNAGEAINAQTHLASFPFGQKKTKTVFVDSGAGAFTRADVTRMCEAAIAASLDTKLVTKASAAKPLGFVVAAGGGRPNICVAFSKESCFPSGTTPAAGALGAPC